MESDGMNVGNLDRAIRIIVGFGVFFWGLHVDTPWGLLGFLLVFSGLFGYDPLYAIARLSTRTTRERLHRQPRGISKTTSAGT